MTEPNNSYVFEQKITKTKPLSVTHKRTHVQTVGLCMLGHCSLLISWERVSFHRGKFKQTKITQAISHLQAHTSSQQFTVPSQYQDTQPNFLHSSGDIKMILINSVKEL